jgi:CTP synthase (UTP-ammonia lyase)
VPLTVAVLIDLPPGQAYHAATMSALAHAAAALDRELVAAVVRTDTMAGRGAHELGDAVVIGPGSPYNDPEAVYDVIRSARERGVPLVGT